MSVMLSPAAPRAMSVGASEDPYKKYWLLILIGFGLTGAWLCVPVMESGVGSAHVDAPKSADAAGEQSLDIPQSADGAPGTALDLSMGPLHRSKGDADPGSMLYQAPGGGDLKDGAPLGSAAGGSSASLAAQLKAVGAKDASGWGGEAAQKGFDMPHLAGGSLSGLGGTSGGNGASASSGMGAFGANNASVGYASTVGLHDDGSADGQNAGAASVAALQNAADQARRAALAHSNDASAGNMSHLFDGAKKGAGIGAPGGGSGAGLYSALDAAPANLKLNDPKLNKKDLKEPTSVPAPPSSNGNQMMQQMAMMAATAVIGGLIPGAGGQMVMMMGMMMIQQQQAQAAQQRADAQMHAHGIN